MGKIAKLNAPDELERADQVPARELERRISELVALFGTRTYAASIAGISTDQLVRYEKGIGTPSFVPLARMAIVKGVGLEWLATGVGPMQPQTSATPADSQPLRPEGLTIAIQLAAEALEGKYLPPPKYAELVTIVYELLEEGLPEAKILRFARAAGPAE